MREIETIQVPGYTLGIKRFLYDEYDSLYVKKDGEEEIQVAAFIDDKALSVYKEFLSNLASSLEGAISKFSTTENVRVTNTFTNTHSYWEDYIYTI